MATEFWTDVEQGKQFELRFRTDNKDYFQHVQEAARACIDGKVAPAAFGTWISVKDAMPYAEYGESDEVLAVDGCGIIKTLYFDGSNWCYPSGNAVDFKYTEYRITHWMPMPGIPEYETDKED